MKNIWFCIYLFVVPIFMLPTWVFAEGHIEASVNYDFENDALVVEGRVDSERSNLLLSLKVTDENGNIIGVSQTKAVFDKKGDIVFTFRPVKFAIDTLSGDFHIMISGHFVHTVGPMIYTYVGPDKLLELLKEFNEGDHAIEKFILENADLIGVDKTKYEALDLSGRSIFKTLMENTFYNLPEDFISPENREKIQNEARHFRKNYQDAIAIGAFASAKTAKDIHTWLINYFEAYDMDKDNPNTPIDEAEIIKYIELVKNEKDFINRIEKSTTLLSMDDVREYIYKSALLATIKERNYSESRKMIEKFPSLFPINRADLAKLSETKQGACYSNIAGQSYNSYADVVAALNAEIEKALPKKDPSSLPGGGGRGASSGSVTIPISENRLPETQEEHEQGEHQIEFDDMYAAPWATEAVTFLTKNGIVKGKGEREFAPNDCITRAEFIKMIIAAMSVKIDEGEASSFTDVSQTDWFAPYVAAAEREGIVFGNDANEFKPNANITRQDMVTLLFRAMNIKSLHREKPEFIDWHEISDYARDAVTYFYREGIIKGVEANIFGALQNATRAQAAQILYNIINN
jgi:hypothetical protein